MVIENEITPSRNVIRDLIATLPAVLDTGFNSIFLIQENHLNQWAGLQQENLVQVDEITAYGKKTPVFRASIWLDDSLEKSITVNPYCVHLYPGIAVCPRA